MTRENTVSKRSGATRVLATVRSRSLATDQAWVSRLSRTTIVSTRIVSREPKRWTRPTRCSISIGFQGTSMWRSIRRRALPWACAVVFLICYILFLGNDYYVGQVASGLTLSLIFLSFVVITVRSRLIGFDRSLEEAAQDLGATPWETFRLITLPLIMPGVLSAALLAFALSIDDFVITNFNSGSTITFPLFIWGAARVAVPPQIYVIATMIFLVTVAAMIITVWQQRRAEKLAAVRPDEPELALEPAPA